MINIKIKIVFLFSFLSFLSFLFSCSTYEPSYKLSNANRTQSKSIKRGVSYSFQGYTDEEMKLLSPGVTWFYNWGSSLTDGIDHSAEFYDFTFFPMAWNDVNANALRRYKTAHPECDYLLAYNEPNLKDQANMTPIQAAEKWPKLLGLAKELNMKIVSPAMNYGTLENYGDPIVWLDEFFTLINPDDISAIAIHCYMGNASALKSYVERFKKYNKPIWVTEFCAYEQFISSSEMQMKFMSDAVSYLELDPDIQRYAWFIPKGGNYVNSFPYMYLLNKEVPINLTDCGKVYVNMSSFDKSVYALAGDSIQAEHFTNCNLTESIDNAGFSNSVHFRPTTDADGELDIYDFTENKWVEYQVELARKGDYYLQIRNYSLLDTDITIYLDSNIVDFITVPESDTWMTYKSLSYSLSFGKHTIRYEVTSGNTIINWFSINIK